MTDSLVRRASSRRSRSSAASARTCRSRTCRPEHLGLPAQRAEGRAGPIHYRQNGRERIYDATFEGVLPNLQRRYRETDSEWIKTELEKFMVERPCPTCGGKRLKPEVLGVTIDGRNISDVAGMSVTDALDWAATIPLRHLSEREQTIARQVLKEIVARLGFLVDVGLDYLTIDRTSSTLSGGEAQRIRLATQIGSSLVGVLYILDEPTIGLHQKDNAKLIATLVRLRDIGNTLIVVEHDEETIRTADWVVDIGPLAGEHGGEVIAAGPWTRSWPNRARSPAPSCAASARCPSRSGGGPATARRSPCATRASTTCATWTCASRLGTFTAVTGVSRAAARARS